MGPDLERLLRVRTWRAFDVDEAGRVLVGWDEDGSRQLVELDTTGPRPLTALPNGCSGRYLRGERAVLVEHDEDGNERDQLSMLSMDPPPEQPVDSDGLTPLVRSPEHRSVLTDTPPGRIVYRTSRAGGAEHEVLIRNVSSGEEETVFDEGAAVTEAVVSPGSRHVAVTVARDEPLSEHLYIVDTMPETEGAHLVWPTAAELPARHTRIGWLAEDVLLVSTDRGREHTALATLTVGTGEWRWLVIDDEHDLLGWSSPDGSMVLVHTTVDGVSLLAMHDAAQGALLFEVRTPVAGWIGYPLPPPAWSPDSRFVVFTCATPDVPGDVFLLDVDTRQLHQLTNSGLRG